MRTITIACAALALSGCVFEDRCVGDAVRDEATGRCTVGQSDAGADAGRDAGSEPDSGRDGGAMEDGGTDGGSDAGMDGGPPPTIVDFAVGAAHACVVDSEGGLTCWGSNVLGQLGTGDVSPQSDPRRLELGTQFSSVAGSMMHTCAQTAEPAVYCWGSNSHGQIGNGIASTSPIDTPHRIVGIDNSRHLAGGFANTCFTGVLGTAMCWGRNDEGQLAIGMSSADVTMPGDTARSSTGDVSVVQSTATADRHTCFLTSDGRLFCAGGNGSGELGVSGVSSADLATQVPGMIDVVSMTVSTSHTCAVQAGDVYCWGDNEFGQTAPAGPDPVLTPTLVLGVGPASQVTTGEGHTCALLESSSVVCWGTRSYGAIGDGMPTSDTSVTAPVAVTGLTDVVRIESSHAHLICALTGSGDLYCWGEDASDLIGGIAPGADSVFLDGETLHTAPVRVDPLE